MTLATLQRSFRNWLTDVPVAMEVWVDGDARAGLDIYHNAYRVQLVECLKDTFEKTLLWIGDDAFINAARTHIEQTPPSGWTLGVYGKGFDQTLASLYPDDPEVAELAWLDWALSRAFECADCVPVAADALTAVDWDQAVLVLIPSIQTGLARTNAGAIWSALEAELTPPDATLLPTPGTMLVWRKDFTPCFRTIEAIEQVALEMVGSGSSFTALCMSLIEQLGSEAGIAQAGAMLAEWIDQGLILAINQPEK
ncbi:hypothetical protein GGQ88_000733 [Novosphingobium hassiacum]|uniref:Putative DNA-binding domain-containing protein n=1 Tax=Novosphingobium hassiacum TaxID=173676 RepID=A0A7W5ZT43_9SPHN|nr:DNA-binding domain-containing protein [Novosphingobium hassiacum]MBB3859493.1 hypothetical protein [Novosphingobium hassiacum]